MKGTVSLEFINFVNPDLKWKTGTKGSRRNSRRGRKSIPSKFGMDSNPADEGTRKVDDTTVSDMDKLHGVTVLGRRFSDSIDQVPIKKRRFALPAYSQFPLSPSPSIDEQESNPNTKQRFKATKATDTLGFSEKISTASCGDTDDFSGIKILAAVACNNGVFSDIPNNEGVSAMEESIAEVVGSSATASDDLVNKDRVDSSLLQGNTVAAIQECPGSNHNGANESASTQMERLHFDLNVPWEQPSDFASVDCGENASLNCQIQGQENYDSTNKLIFSDVVGDHHASGDHKGKPDETYAVNEEDAGTGGSGQEENHGEYIPSQLSNIQQKFTSDSVDAKNICPDYSNEGLNISLCALEAKQISNVCSLNIQLGNDICSESTQDETCNKSSPSLKQSRDDDSQKASGSCEDEPIHQDTIHLLGCQPVQPISLAVEPAEHPEKSESHECVPSDADPSDSAMPNVDEQHITADDVKGQHNENSAVNSAEEESLSHSGSVGLVQKSLADSSVTTREASSVHGHGDTDSLAKATLENPSDDSSESDVYQADKVHVVCPKKSVELQAGYDSQFEDGELRESDVPYCWDDNVEDCEVEHVDYGSDWDDDRLSGLGNEQEERVDRGSSPGCDTGSKKIEHTGAEDAPRDDLVSLRTKTPEVLTNKEFTSELFGSRSSNREMVSRFEGSNSVHRSDDIPRNRGDIYYNLYSRGSGEAGSKNVIRRERLPSHMRGRSPESRRFVEPSDVCWNLERRYSPTYRGSCTSGLPRLKGSVENRGYVMASDHTDSEVVGFVGRENRARRPFINPSYKGAYERIDRRSPGSRDGVYSTTTGMLPIRDGSPIRGRFRRFPQGTTRSTREQYHGSLAEDNNEYSNRFTQRLSRRERSISPNRGRPHYVISYKRSRSRSRSRSPISYLPPRERHEGSRFRSRSPDFRPGTRVDRGRAPFQKRFPSEFDDEFVPQTRRRFEPQRPSRCFDDRNGACDDFRGRKSPSAIVQQGQRFSSARSGHNRSDSDDHRSYLPSRKFLDTGGSGSGGVYEGSEDDRRAPSNRFETVHRVRRYDTDGVMRRFMANDSHNDSYRVVNRGPREIVSYSGYWR